MRKIIFNLSMAVDEVIHKCMKEFKKLGVEAKAMQDSKASEEDLAIIHKRMSDIYCELELFDYRVRELYPNMKGLFDIFSLDIHKRYYSVDINKTYDSVFSSNRHTCESEKNKSNV